MINPNNWKTAAGLGAALLMISASTASAQSTRVHLDQETTVGGIGVGCTGIGQTKNDPKWQAYSVRLEFAAANGEYLAGEVVRLVDAKGEEVLDVSCEGPWLLIKLPPGEVYEADAALSEVSAMRKTAKLRAPSHGQPAARHPQTPRTALL